MFEINKMINPKTEFYDIISDMCKKKIKNVKKDLKKNPLPHFDSILDWLEKDDYKNLERIIISKPEQLLDIYEKEIRKFDKFSETIYTDNGIAKCTKETEKNDETTKPEEDEELSDKEVENSTTIKSEADKESSTIKRVKDCWETIFDYKNFRDNYSYGLAAKLGVNVCPYCNRQYIHTVTLGSDGKSHYDEESKRTNIIRPEFDHFFPQASYPMFALSLYNLIPSCHVCNSNIKGFRELNIKEHFHPYIQENKNFCFKYDNNTDKNTIYSTKKTITIDYAGNKKAENTCKFFYLPDIYKSHNHLADEIDDLREEFPPDLIEDMVEKINSLNCDDEDNSPISKKEILQLVFGKFMVKNENDEILGKLRNDLYKQVSKHYTKEVNKMRI